MENKDIFGMWTNATDLVAGLDHDYYVMHVIVTLLLLTVLLPMFWFIYKYSEKNHPIEVMPEKALIHHTGLEITWTLIPTAILMFIFYIGYDSLKNLRTMPANAMEVKVVGKMWSWTYIYPDGKITDKLYVPKGEDVVLNLTAPEDDVLHSFWIPAFRTKEDVVPGRTTKLWFNANQVGSYDVECTEYCGDRHSYMLSKVVVIPKVEYTSWVNSTLAYPGGPDLNSEPAGKTLLTNNGCLGCHSLEDMVLVGPGFKGIVDREVATNNGTLKSDYQYLKDAILDPDKDVVDGYSPGMMPSSQGVLSEKDIKDIVDYLKTIK